MRRSRSPVSCVLGLLLTRHLGLRKLARRHLALKEDIQLAVRPSLHLGKTEKGPNKRAEPGTGPEKACLAAP